MITWDNYEEYMVMQADGELSQAQEQELMNFLFEHPELQAELTTFTMLKLKPDSELVYNRKEELLKPVAGGLVMKLNSWRQYAVAAGILLLMTIGGYNAFVNQDVDNSLAASSNNTTKKPISSKIQSQIASVKDAAVQDDKNIVAPNNNHSISAPIAVLKSKNLHVAVNNERKIEVHENEAFPKPDIIGLEPIDAPSAKALAVNVIDENPIIGEVSISSGYAENETKQGFLDKLPISELKKGGLREVAQSITNSYEKVNVARQEIYATDISVKIEKRKIVLSF